MKIGFFTDYYLPSVAGVTISIEAFKKKLEERNHKVFIFAPACNHYIDKDPNVYRFKSLTLSKERDIYLAFPFLPDKFRLKRILDLKLDIVHAHSPFSLGFIGKYVSLKQKIPFVYTHHTNLSEYAKFYLKENFITPYLAQIWSTWFSDFSDAVIAPSCKVKKILEGYGVKKKISIISTGVNIGLFKKCPEQKEILRKKIGVSSQTKILLFVGRMELEKNPLFLVEAFNEILKQINDVVLLMVGCGVYVNKAKKFAKRLGIEKSVIFTGKVPYSDIPSYYQGSDIFCFSSLTETQGIVILEAEAAGLPIVALKDDAFVDIVKNKENGFLVKELSPKVFAGDVIKILKNPGLYNSFSLSSQKIAKSFSEEKQTEKLLNLYKELLKKS